MRVTLRWWMLLTLFASGCSYTVVEPGHRGLMFDPDRGGLQREVLHPGRYKLPSGGHVEDFEVIFSKHRETVAVSTSDGGEGILDVSVIYRPIMSELYELGTELGRDYYAQVIGPEFQSTARGVFARHALSSVRARNEPVENEIEAELRRRVHGKHVEISSVVIESLKLSPASQARLLLGPVGGPCTPNPL